MSNAEVAKVLREIGEYLEMQGVAFKPRAYEKAADAVAGSGEQVSEIYEKGGLKTLEEIPGVGASIAEKIEELLKTGRLKYYEELKKKTPVDLGNLVQIEGLGPKNIKKLYENLKIKNLDDLEKAARAGKIRRLESFGEKSEERILKGIEFLKKSGGRAVLGFIMPVVRNIEERLKSLGEVEKVAVCGSIRRMQETIGDIDILVTSKKPRSVIDYFAAMPEVEHVYGKGETKTMVRLKIGLDADLRVVEPVSYGAAVQYFTGSKEHNIALREIAIKKGYKLNEYGLFSSGGGDRMIAGRDEKEIYEKLGLMWMPPELRTDSGEIEAAKTGKLPKLIEYGSLQGDLQIQTDWTDGKNSIEEMARAAVSLGLEYIAITDHTERLAMTGGLDKKKIVKQWAEIDKIQRKLGGRIKILKGTECDILKDGSLDLPDKVLAKLDVVGVAIHSRFNLSRRDQTERIKKAISNKHVHIFFHPTGRIIGRREAYEINMDEITETAKKTGTVLEIDAFPARLDLKDEHIRKCVAAGVKMSIDSDAHSVSHFQYLEFGIAQARRGWAERNDIINAWPLEKMRKFLKR
ncbi:DNA polymerase III [Candidatus Jorgensenbacteria bacterium GWA1_49_17]|uniref:DNA polymerase beta n=1 Tax=Candidatus Jorgensenbacteria bacterium GWA1_49_17 TaxID=1798467 RepID=A0A1F6BUB2_9BACT|nr:MAG: DNA polymerase III [Candidatus Jorgensenbacteria bacterium GWA1_49_17]